MTDNRRPTGTDYGQTEAWRQPSPTTVCKLCRGFYIDDEAGRAAHRTVFGHTPREDEP